ncbi:SpaA isopeptide-forming pilin-related protein [Cellulomonas hominis]|uniref:DUF7927 domain-containing protein n=1 Tax=Cellulomonas hominis TaxID=156981 RepID=UPI001B912B5C|nr:SpaA isopeptide-forming pilin-related protein [Cellulomonas hominis]VTR78228.1 hypothetical protein CHMI_03004 [Cellulomonas hominis]
MRVVRNAVRVLVACWATSAAVAGLGVVGAVPASAAENDGLSVTVTPAEVTTGSTTGFTIGVTDTNVSGAVFDQYRVYGLATGWQVYEGDAQAAPTSPDPIIFEVSAAAVQQGLVRIVPPAAFAGTLPGVRVARVSASPNLVTDFDHGTFDHLGVARPTLPAGTSAYAYHNPTTLISNSTTCQSAQYGPCDGQYSIWPTARMTGPLQNFNNRWADLRSRGGSVMSSPSTTELCREPMAPWTAATEQVTDTGAQMFGKILVVNGSTTMPVPNDLVTTTVTGLEPNSLYTFSGSLANASYDTGYTLPVRSGFYLTGASPTGTLVGSTQPMPVQPGCTTGSTRWTRLTSAFDTGASTSITIALRNFAGGGRGNDLVVDDLTLYPMAADTLDLTVRAPVAGFTVSKTASVASVHPGDTVEYAVQVTNAGDVAYTEEAPASFTDDLSGVLDDATVVPGSASPGVVVSGGTATWSGALPVGGAVTVRYAVRVDDPVLGDRVLRNTVLPSAPGGTCDEVVGCSTQTPVEQVTVQVAKEGESSTGEVVRMAGSAFELLADHDGVPGDVLPAAGGAETATGLFEFTVAPGTYWVRETVAPRGFALLAQPVRFTVAADGVVTLDGTAAQVTADGSTITVRDVPSFALPVTGGPGTASVYAAGALLVAVPLAGRAWWSRRQARGVDGYPGRRTS